MTTFSPAPTEKKQEPAIPVGLGTSLGVLGTFASALTALVSALLTGDHSAEVISALASAVVLLGITVAGRFAQAYAIYRDAPNQASMEKALEILIEPDPVPPPLPQPSTSARRRY